MAVTKIHPVKSTLKKALDYIQNPDKTDEKMLVFSFGCSFETADIEFGFTLSQAINKGNNLAHHLIQSFEPGEVDYETAHEIGRQLADAVTKGRHEYVLTTHIDKGHVHNHILFCAVDFIDHKKYVSNKRSYYGIRNMSDRLGREHGLSVVVPERGSRGKSYTEYQAEKTGTSYKAKLKAALDSLIPQAGSFEELLRLLQGAGYEHWAKIHNLKQAARTVNFLTEQRIEKYADLSAKIAELQGASDKAADSLKDVEKRLADLSLLMKHIAAYQKTRGVYAAYRKAADKESYRAAHESDIILHEAAVRALTAAGIAGKLPDMKTLREEYKKLTAQKETLYADYGKLKNRSRNTTLSSGTWTAF